MSRCLSGSLKEGRLKQDAKGRVVDPISVGSKAPCAWSVQRTIGEQRPWVQASDVCFLPEGELPEHLAQVTGKGFGRERLKVHQSP